MGRIDEALRLSNVDAVRGTGAPAPTADPSPWRFERHEDRDAAEPSMSASDSAADAPALPEAPSEDRRRPSRVRVDARAVERLVVAKTAPPLLVEQFRGLAATLHGAQREQPLKSVMVTSASPGDGKSHVAVNLALTLSGSYHRDVLLIDADLRRPSLHHLFGLSNSRGLSEALAGKTDDVLPTVEIADRLTLLPAGHPQQDPLGGLASERMRHIVENAVARYDWVIVDSPPVGVLADGRLVAEMVDGAILVVRAGVTRFPDVEAAADTLGHERVLGIVLNAVDPVEIRGEGYYRRYYYGRETGETPSRPAD